jgi:cytidylate kinase
MKIAIYGPMCSGKTTVAKIIQEIDERYEIYSFGQKIKELASELFDMKGKDRSLLIHIADKMREIDKDVWVKNVIRQTRGNEFCLIDDLRFQNELNHLKDWKIICLITPEEVRVRRLKEIYPDNYEDHIKNMMHPSETDTLNFPSSTVYIDTNMDSRKLKDFLTLCLKTGLKIE